MDGTCIEAPEKKSKIHEDETIVFTFHSDVSSHPEIVQALEGFNAVIHKTLEDVSQCAESWLKYQSLWKQVRAAFHL